MASPEGRVHTTGVAALWLDGTFFFTSGPRTRKSRNLAANPSCTIAVALPALDLVVEGTARRRTDGATLRGVTEAYVAQGWPARVEGDGVAAEFSAPTAGPSPWHLWHLAHDRVSSSTTTVTSSGSSNAYELLGPTIVVHRVDVEMSEGRVHQLEVIGAHGTLQQARSRQGSGRPTAASRRRPRRSTTMHLVLRGRERRCPCDAATRAITSASRGSAATTAGPRGGRGCASSSPVTQGAPARFRIGLVGGRSTAMLEC